MKSLSPSHNRHKLICVKCGDPRADNSQAYCRKCFFIIRIGMKQQSKYDTETFGDSTDWFCLLNERGVETRYYGDLTSCKS